MKVAGEYRFDAPPDEVWEALLDPEVLAAIMPGCKKLELTGEHQYEGILDMKVGPVQGQFKGKVNLENFDAPHGYDLRLDGQGAPGFVSTFQASHDLNADANRCWHHGRSGQQAIDGLQSLPLDLARFAGRQVFVQKGTLGTIDAAIQPHRHQAGSASRRRWLMTPVMPSPRMLTP